MCLKPKLPPLALWLHQQSLQVALGGFRSKTCNQAALPQQQEGCSHHRETAEQLKQVATERIIFNSSWACPVSILFQPLKQSLSSRICVHLFSYSLSHEIHTMKSNTKYQRGMRIIWHLSRSPDVLETVAVVSSFHSHFLWLLDQIAILLMASNTVHLFSDSSICPKTE